MHLEDYVIDARGSPRHLAWWAGHFGVSHEALLITIAAVGGRADAVRTYLVEQPRQEGASRTVNDPSTEL